MNRDYGIGDLVIDLLKMELLNCWTGEL